MIVNWIHLFETPRVAQMCCPCWESWYLQCLKLFRRSVSDALHFKQCWDLDSCKKNVARNRVNPEIQQFSNIFPFLTLFFLIRIKLSLYPMSICYLKRLCIPTNSCVKNISDGKQWKRTLPSQVKFSTVWLRKKIWAIKKPSRLLFGDSRLPFQRSSTELCCIIWRWFWAEEMKFCK